VKAWFLGLPRRKQDGLIVVVALAGLFALSLPTIEPYLMNALLAVNLLFWVGTLLFVVVGLIAAALTTRQ